MLYRAFSVYDSKARIFNLPFYFINVGEALRAFSDLANDLTTSVGRHPHDFSLQEIGTYDALTGHLLAVHPFVNHGLAAAFVRDAAPCTLPFPSVSQELSEPTSRVGFPGEVECTE